MSRSRKKETKTQAQDSTLGRLEVPDDEKWRLITESGVLTQTPTKTRMHDIDEDNPLGEEIFNATLLIIPMSSLLLMMEILIHYQYGKKPSLQALVDRMTPGVPILSIFIFYSAILPLFFEIFTSCGFSRFIVAATRYKRHRRMQFFLFVLSILVGPRMLYILKRAPWLVNMRQCPPLATIWMYTIVQLDLGLAVLNLILVASYVWWKGLEIF